MHCMVLDHRKIIARIADVYASFLFLSAQVYSFEVDGILAIEFHESIGYLKGGSFLNPFLVLSPAQLHHFHHLMDVN